MSEDQHQEIANCTLSIRATAKQYATTQYMVRQIKKAAGTFAPNNHVERKITPAQKLEVIKSDLSAKELSEIYGLHTSRINRIKRDAGVPRSRSHKNNMIAISDYNMSRIKDVTISARNLSKEIGLTGFIINSRRRDLGIVFKPLKKESAKREYKPRPKKEPRVKIERIKVVKEPILNQSTKNLNKQKKTVFEEQNEAMRKALKAKELYNAIEAKKIEDGARWIQRVDRFGKKSMVLSKV